MDYSNRSYHEVIRGSRFGLPEGKQYPAGFALSFEGVNYYILKLWFQQEKSFYIKKNDEQSSYYTIYSKKEVQSDSTVRLLNPVGFARGTGSKTHLEIILPDFPKRYYMSLFAKE